MEFWTKAKICGVLQKSVRVVGLWRSGKLFQGRGPGTLRWDITWAWLLCCCYQQDPAKGPQAHQRGRDLSQCLGIPSEPSTNGVLVFPAQYTGEVSQHTERQHYGGSNHPIPVCTYTMTEPWGTYPQKPVQQEHIRHPPVNWRDERVQGRQKHYTVLGQCSRKWHNLKWWLKPAQWRESRQYITKSHWTLAVLRQILYSIYEG